MQLRSQVLSPFLIWSFGVRHSEPVQHGNGMLFHFVSFKFAFEEMLPH